MKANLWADMPSIIEYIGTCAIEAMMLEANCAPAPGLVDRYNSGAHNDMDIFTFIISTTSLAPFMYSMARIGYEHDGGEMDLLQAIRPIGLRAERAMLKATKGVNTQKGLIFLMGIICSASGYVYKHHRNITIQSIILVVKSMCSGLVERELTQNLQIKREQEYSHGEILYMRYGIRGIRGEVEDGLPTIINIGLPAYTEALNRGFTDDNALIHALLGIMSVSEDTTILHRHSMSVLKEVQRYADELYRSEAAFTTEGLERIKQLDNQFIERYISPGGSADLLAATHFLYSITHELTHESV